MNISQTYKDDKRLGIDRREFSYTAYFPERRSGKDRRTVSHPISIQIHDRQNEIENQKSHHCTMY